MEIEDRFTLFWFRQDLRISDNPGLFEATKQGVVLPIYILDDQAAEKYPMGSASRVWLHSALNHLNTQLHGRLNVYQGASQKILLNLLQSYPLNAVYWNRCYEPWQIKKDKEIIALLKKMAIAYKSFNAQLLWEPWEILKKDRSPYKVYSFYYRNGCLKAPPPRMPFPIPKKLNVVKDLHNLNTIETLDLLPKIKWYQPMMAHWKIGEKAAQQKLARFLEKGLLHYREKRNYPDQHNVSKLSMHLHFGEISPHQIWHASQSKAGLKGWTNDLSFFLSELAWREFSYYLLYHFPQLPYQNFQSKFDLFPWQTNTRFLNAWQKGQTGYPIIDAGMRELWQTGYMHNRVRMIVASFLVKNLRIHWHDGAKWFWDCLVDADLANNSASWQWVAGSGADAAPYFRIFNPITQGEKFDSEGNYTRRFVPELAQLPNAYLFKPWQAPSEVLKAANVILGKTYPNPIVDLQTSRKMAMEAYQALPKL